MLKKSEVRGWLKDKINYLTTFPKKNKVWVAELIFKLAWIGFIALVLVILKDGILLLLSFGLAFYQFFAQGR